MNTADDETPSGLNVRLRPRKSHGPNPQSHKVIRKADDKPCQDKPKKTSTPSKASPNKHVDLVTKSDFTHTQQFLCAYCDKKFASKQAVSKHARRMHLPTSKQDLSMGCLYCNHIETNANNIIHHMVHNHPNQYFACLECHTRFSSTSELAQHKLNICEKQKHSYRSKLRQKISQSAKKSKKSVNPHEKDPNLYKEFDDGHNFNGIVISCELKPSQVRNEEDIEDNITTNLILPPSKSLGSGAVLEKNAVIVLDDIQWNKRIPSNFSFHNTDTDQILSRLGVVHRSPRTGESTRKDWFRTIDDTNQKFERCFDTSFYSKVASNVQENLSKFLDGSFNFIPDPDNIIKTRKSKNSVVINTAEGFPILLACEQYSRSVCDGYMPRALAPKHKWKWDNLESDRNLINHDQIKRDSHTNNCIITLVSSLDIWTQLCMRRKFEDKFNNLPLEKKTEKQNVLGKELKEILESREIPSTSQVVKYKSRPTPSSTGPDFPASLGLTPSVPSFDLQPAVLSGEWVRPRCYVCCACGTQTRDSRKLSSHISTQHPNAQVQHYEIVGELLLNSDILKHLYVPPSQMSNRTRPLRGIRECTKCKKSITLDDLHQHMLDCAGDTPTVRRRQIRYRPFGVRRRRPRLPDNTVRKRMRKDIRTRQRRQKNLMRPRQRIRTEVGDAETIRKMLADLPAKRHRVLLNPMSHGTRPHRKLDKQRNKMILKKRQSMETKNHEQTNKETNHPTFSGSTNTDGIRKDSSNKDDDDDNKPLKSTVSRMVIKNTRRNPSVKRKPTINRAKRKCVRDKEQRIGYDSVAASNSKTTVELLVDESTEKIDVKAGTYKIKEHANRDTANNRDEQRAGCSNPTGNSNNSFAPTPNVPLKHSIARLTANSERHDKSVQFHHLFLVQQECNNTDQHISSGQTTLFENEAIVTKLDKPPLSSISRGSIDLQKSKINKPRKGLNDCIAMLKNKLIDPVSDCNIGYISVQCGSDEPLNEDMHVIEHNMPNINLKTNITIEMPQDDFKPISPEGPEINQSSPTHTDITVRQNYPKEKSDHFKSLKLAKQQNLPVQEMIVSPPNSFQNKSKALESVSEHIIHKESNELVANEEISNNLFQNRYLNISQHQKLPSGRDLNGQQSFVVTEKEKNENLSVQNNYAETSLELDLVRQNASQVSLTKTTVVSHKTSEATAESLLNTHDQIALPSESDEIILNQAEIVRDEIDLVPKPPNEIFTESDLINIPTDIPPAHASTNVISMLATPLDLSAKIINTYKPEDLSEQKKKYGSGYDSNGTLDLSNKCLDKSNITNVINDVVVDLRVKPTHSECQPNVVDLCLKSTVTEVNDILYKEPCVDNFPTDLSMKKQDKIAFIETSKKRLGDADCVQDLSSNRIDIQGSEIICDDKKCNRDCSKDLYSKDTEGATSIQSIGEVTQYRINIPCDLTEPGVRRDDSFVVSKGSSDDSQKQVQTMLKTQNTAISISLKNKNTLGQKKAEDKSAKSTMSSVNDRSVQIQKPVYDPTLKIPQYKIRTTLATTTKTSSGFTDDADFVNTSAKMVAVTNYVCSTSTQDYPLAKPSTALQEDKSYSLEKTHFNVSICSVVQNIPDYNITSSLVASSNSKLETTLVYTLANPYKKVEQSHVDNRSTLASSSTVYTSSKTAAETYTNYDPISCYGPNNPNHSSNAFISDVLQTSSSEVIDKTRTTSTKIEGESKLEDTQIIKALVNTDQDFEMARKIAMLPKELVEILGTMPADHRNQLLNVLPQYVSTSTVTPVSQCEITDTSNNTNTKTVDSSAMSINREATNTTAVLNSESRQTTSSINSITSPVVSCQNSNLCISVIDQINNDKILTNQFSGQLNSNIQSQNSIEDMKSPSVMASLDVKNDSNVIPDTHEGSFVGVIDNGSSIVSQYSNTVDRVIDLTAEDVMQPNNDVTKVPHDVSRSSKLLSDDSAGFDKSNEKSIRQKGNNEKTASLRAVRIKAPSERLKDNQLLNKSSIEKSNATVTDLYDSEIKKSLDSKKSLAIQQAEISSTQHSNKNITVKMNFPNEHSSAELQTNDEHIIKSRRTSTLDDGDVKKDKDVDHVDNPAIKSSLVTSSISANEPNRNENNDLNIEEKIDVLSNTSKLAMTLEQGANTSNQNFTIQDCNESAACFKRNDLNLRDDDSDDDDVSLAIIVKQKQQERLQNEESVVSKVPIAEKPKNKKKKKEKKHKKVTVEDIPLGNTNENLNDSIVNDGSVERNSIKFCSTGNISSNRIETIKATDISNSQLKHVIDVSSTVHKRSKNKTNIGNKFKLSHGSVSAKNVGSSIKPRNLSASCINEEIESEVALIKSTMEEGSMKSDNTVDNATDDVSRNENDIKLFSHEDSKKSSHDLGKQGFDADKHDSTIEDSYDNLISAEEHKNEINQNLLENKSQDPNIDQEGTKNNSIKLDLASPVISSDVFDSSIEAADLSNQKTEQIPLLDESKNKRKTLRMKKPKDLDAVSRIPNIMKSSSDKNEDNITPLRRSRRGKSLFVEGDVCVEDDLTYTESSLDQKTPLTKKQLIFSKLLLDEESQTKTKDTICEKGLRDFSSPNLSDNDSAYEISIKRTKQAKRKKSPEVKQKSKKTKSESCRLENDFNAAIFNKNTEENSLKTQSRQNKTIPTTEITENRIVERNLSENILSESVSRVEITVECSSTVTSMDHFDQNKLTITAEKRKNDSKTININQSPSPKFKKSKLNNETNDEINKNLKENINDITSDSKVDQSISPSYKRPKLHKEIHIDSENENIKIDKSTANNLNQNVIINTEVRSNTCYNLPIAAKRTRSKSVVVKSSNSELYDPYDLDLDDMSEQTEPLAKKSQMFKQCNINNKLKLSTSSAESNINSLKASTDRFKFLQCAAEMKLRNEAHLDSVEQKVPKTNTKDEHEQSQVTVDTDTIESVKINSSSESFIQSSAYDIKSSERQTDHSNDALLEEVKDKCVRDNISDSDESSKSDVPLKKYVEEKEKKLAELGHNSDKEIDDVDDSETLSDKQKKSRRTLTVCNNVNSVTNETEDQLRSEQFMESFGFFSERKPRKSNLLATKKISETFHIIANESDDMYFGFKDRTVKRSLQNENRKSVEGASNVQHTTAKRPKRGRKKKSCTKTTPCYCGICKKEFRRPDNYLRHQMTLLHISKLSEIEMKIKTAPVHEEPNYLIAYKQQLDRLKILTDKLAKRKKNSKTKITLPTLEEILADVNRTVREQQLSRRGLSRDEALFLDCCELLKESHKSDAPSADTAIMVSDVRNIVCPLEASVSGAHVVEKTIGDERADTKSDGDVDSITAKNILESEEVRNLENDLISGLKEYHQSSEALTNVQGCTETYSNVNIAESHYNQLHEFDIVEDPDISKNKKHQSETKDKMYPDPENIDIFEDKFDKIKRKCRSQAAAAKQSQTVSEPSSSHKVRKKSEKKKSKKNIKKSYQNTVLTKGALKGFDGIKVSIPTSDINISAIVPHPIESSLKKKKKINTKKKKEKKESESSNRYDSDNRGKDNSSIQKKLDVYEFMDNEDAELFEFRPSTLMERFKSVTNKEAQSKDTSKYDSVVEDAENSSESGSDGDDFVYMSDDYVCSDDETENSLLSCEMGNVKLDTKKSSTTLKRRDVVEKNAVMGKIFKHAVRSEKKCVKPKDVVKPKANLDQLFDSLLEDEPSTSFLTNDDPSEKDDFEYPSTKNPSSKFISKSMKTQKNDSFNKDNFVTPKKVESLSSNKLECITSSNRNKSSSVNAPLRLPPNKNETSKKYVCTDVMDFGPSTSKNEHHPFPTDFSVSKKHNKSSPKKRDSSKEVDASDSYGEPSTSYNDSLLYESKDKVIKEKSPVKTLEDSYEYSTEFDQTVYDDDTGVARQRARRKCTVGKQNILAETWSSESEADGVLPRPNSAESVVIAGSRKKKGKKKESHQPGSRRGNRHVSIKKQNIESRVNSSNRKISISDSVAGGNHGLDAGDKGEDDKGVCSPTQISSPISAVTPDAQGPIGGAPGPKGRPRSAAYYWSSEGDDEQEHLQQHGWIVGDSHKKLVTMLAHAKGRKRNNDDKRHLIE